MNYVLDKEKILETQTGLIVYESTKEDLKKKVKQLNSGSGFRGYTPEFFLQRVYD